MTRYLSGLCVAGLGLCGGGWLVVAAVAFGGEPGGRAGRVNLLTGAVLIAVCCLSLVCWSRAWRQRMRADGVLVSRFQLVPRREARRNRRALNRDVRRAARLAERSARDARRAARRSSRLASGAALGEDGALGEGVALGVAEAGDEQYSAAALYGGVHVTAPNGAGLTGAGLNGVGSNGAGSNGAGSNGAGLNGSAAGAADSHDSGAPRPDAGGNGASESGANGAGANPGERAAELISELRLMLEPLLAATGGQPTLAATGAQPSLAGQPGSAEQTAAAAPPLPQRTRFASAARPRATPAEMAAPRARQAPMSIPRLAAVDDYSPGPASDGEDAWW
jgi:hypothetical protein